MSTLTIRIDENLKKEASQIYEETGLNLSSAITLFLKQTVIKRKFPLTIESEIAKDYVHTYPKGFFDLCGSIKEDMEEPIDLPLESEDFDV